MTQQQLALNLDGRARRDAGLDSLERHGFVHEARRVAARICRERGSVTMDVLREEVSLPPGVHHNVFGSILRYPYFVRIGSVQSQRPEAHARWIHEWITGPGALA